MENHPNIQDKVSVPLQVYSLNTTSHGSSSYGSSTNGATTSPPPSAPPPPTPKSIPKPPEVNPYPTTFVQADTSSFKQVVQMLTGSTETAAAAASKGPIAPASKPPGPKKPAFKLYERRNSLKNLKITSPLIPAFFASNSNPDSPVAAAAAFSPRMQPEILSPSMLDFPSLVLSPVTPLIPDPFNRSPHPCSEAAKLAEDRAIAEKGFYLHPSPRTTPRDAEPPRLLPLFPETSPSVSSSASPVTTSSPSPSPSP